jgi:hypothetical protein
VRSESACPVGCYPDGADNGALKLLTKSRVRPSHSAAEALLICLIVSALYFLVTVGAKPRPQSLVRGSEALHRRLRRVGVIQKTVHIRFGVAQHVVAAGAVDRVVGRSGRKQAWASRRDAAHPLAVAARIPPKNEEAAIFNLFIVHVRILI